jgi:hypothetical protein
MYAIAYCLNLQRYGLAGQETNCNTAQDHTGSPAPFADSMWHVTLFHQAGPYNEVPLNNYIALSWTLCTLQVTLATLTSLLQEAQLSGKPTTCSDILHAVDAPALITLLCSATISNTEAAYGSRTAALHLLTQLNACIRLTWDSTPGAMPGSEWDSAVVGAKVHCVHGTTRSGKNMLRHSMMSMMCIILGIAKAGHIMSCAGTLPRGRGQSSKHRRLRKCQQKCMTKVANMEPMG